ncbi:zinc ribbon domain-containing protein [Pseudomonas aeruginosa]|uniref:zinc ribbon domain-containing protein n=1 Tax=Pseudomonas aeruginosa TaxID=287 RepID=UPI000EDF9C74|nr:zinc ribbon domain-containing protein [Pseudomonas aeruginosa]RIZ48477.1 hypothetical protein AXX02_10140 [Pseudomonas aeruginosa]
MKSTQEELDFKELESHEFEERADYLPDSYIKDKTAKGQYFDEIQKKLFQVGAKLLIGPRGTGKTHHMRLAYISCKEDKAKPLPIYVSFNHYLRLETYLNETSNAIGVFHAWVLSKILLDCLKTYNITPEQTELEPKNLQDFIEAVEKQQYNSNYDAIVQIISVEKTQGYIEDAIQVAGRKRAVLLLDDAALTLTPEYMVEFFEIFRSLKTAHISPKASVYPGTTQYGPRFHLGHDAEPIHVWLNVENPKYIEFMSSLTENRFESDITIPQEILTLFKYAAFGIPRAYIMMVREYQQLKTTSTQSRFNKVISDRKKYMLAEYLSIGDKLKQYQGMIGLGSEFLNNTVANLKKFNHERIDRDENTFEKVIAVGVTGIPPKAERMIRFLIEAGLLYETDDISHGPGRKLRRFIPHVVLLLEGRVLTKSRGFKSSELLEILKRKSAKHPSRPSFEAIIAKDKLSMLNLNLPPCHNCQAERMTEKQKFCHECGKPLIDHSTFKECMAKPLNELPLTRFQIKAIDTFTSFKTVEDVIRSQDPANELQKAHRVKAARAEDIYRRINQWVNEFLV